ncbi:unnamed protein product, partial [marine sediment metagenome]
MGLKELFSRKNAEDDDAIAAQADQTTAESIGADRGIPSINTKRRTSAGTRAMQLLILLIGLGILATSVKVIVGKMGTRAEEAPRVEKKKDEQEKISNRAPLSLAEGEAAAGGTSAPALPASSPAVPLVQATTGSEQAAGPVGVRPNAAGNGRGGPGDGKAVPEDPEERRLKTGLKYGQDGVQELRQAAGGGDSLLGGSGAGLPSGGNNGLGPLL